MPAGEELEIRGSGLTSDCTVTLGNGAKVKFYVTATFETAEGVIGTVSGNLKTTGTDGATLVCQDEGPLVLRNRSRSATLGYADWTNAQGESAKWTQGAVAVINPFDKNGRLDGIHYASKICVGGAHDGYWDGDTSAVGSFRIGSGGIEFTVARQWALARGSYIYSGGAMSPRVVLMENQTWTNSAASGRSYLQYGFGYQVPDYNEFGGARPHLA